MAIIKFLVSFFGYRLYPASAMHFSAPVGYKCSDCTIGNDVCPICYARWYGKLHNFKSY